MSEVSENVCQHTDISNHKGVAYCSDCGEEIICFVNDENTYFPTSRDGEKAPKSIRKELENLPLSDEIKDRADKIYGYKAGNNTYRAKVRQEVKFICIKEAFHELGLYKDPREIAAMLGLQRKGMSRGVKRCSYLYTGKESTSKEPITALNLVPGMLTQNGVEYDNSHLEDIQRIYEYTKEYSESINRSNPQSIAAALIYFYLRKKDPSKKLMKTNVAKNCYVSVMTISKIDNELEKICGEMMGE